LSPRHDWNDLQKSAHAWQLHLDGPAAGKIRKRCLAWLSNEEHTHVSKLLTDSLRTEYLAAHALLRAALSSYVGVDPAAWTFGVGVSGKPKITRPAIYRSIRFNLSHTSGLVVVLISCAGVVGVDVENTARTVDVMQVARHFFSNQEQACLKDLSPKARRARFFAQWVAREAYLKGVGKGVASGNERLTIGFDATGRPKPIRDWRFFLHHPTPKHVAAAAVRSLGGRSVLLRWLAAEQLFR
jgi:4'-phosphopantetheinyl transferase